MVMCVWSLVDCILWIWASGNDGRVPNIIQVYFFARLLRVSRTLIFLSFADGFLGVKFHGSFREYFLPCFLEAS
jgi:hypothetical protein